MNKANETILGNKYNRLTVVSVSHKKGLLFYFKCLCDCGKTKTSLGYSIVNGQTTSCGCLRVEKHTKHGHARRGKRPAEYLCWVAIHTRCNNKKRQDYKNYGGRGIKVSSKFNTYEGFYRHIGPRPTSKHSIDRIDNEGDYAPGNVRWATRKEQNSNTRRSLCNRKKK